MTWRSGWCWLLLASLFLNSAGRVAAEQAAPQRLRLRLHGSNSIGGKLAPAWAEAFLLEQGVGNVQRSTVGTNEQVFTGTNPKTATSYEVQVFAHGSSTGFESLGSGKCDLAMSSRQIRAEEVARLAHLGDLRSEQAEHFLGYDGLSIVAHAQGNVPALDLETLQKVLTGKVVSWAQLGGADLPVRVHARDEKSGSFALLESTVLGRNKLATGTRRYESNEQLLQAVAKEPGSIGLASLGNAPKPDNLRVVSLEVPGLPAQSASPFGIASGDYLFSRPLLLYSAEQPANPLVPEFLRFAASDAGQALLAEAGFVPAALQEHRPGNFPYDIGEEPSLLVGASRLSVSLRLDAEGRELDLRSQREVNRIAQYLRSEEHQRKVLLLGFSDNQGKPQAIQRRAIEAAITAEVEFIANGIKPMWVREIGAAAPIASNDSEAGRARNRRVEVWLLDWW